MSAVMRLGAFPDLLESHCIAVTFTHPLAALQQSPPASNVPLHAIAAVSGAYVAALALVGGAAGG
jgi:hypothetical protein